MKILRLLFLILLISGTSCSVPDNRFPTINFIGGEGMVDQDVTLMKDTTFKIGINSFTTSKYEIVNFKLTRISDNLPEIIIDSTINNIIFNSVFILPTSEKENTERWFFEFTCSDGYKNSISVQIKTINPIISEEEIFDEEHKMPEKVNRKRNNYTVQPGDTWHKISKQYNITLDELLDLNSNVELLKYGMRIYVPNYIQDSIN